MLLPQSLSTTQLLCLCYDNCLRVFSTFLKTWSLFNEDSWAQYLRRAGYHSLLLKHSLLRAQKDTGLFDSSLSKDVKMLKLIKKHPAIDADFQNSKLMSLRVAGGSKTFLKNIRNYLQTSLSFSTEPEAAFSWQHAIYRSTIQRGFGIGFFNVI